MVLLAISGLLHSTSPFGAVHRWTAHGLVILIWCAAPLALVAHYVMRRRMALFGVLLALVFVAAFFASVTGYLDPSEEELAAHPVHMETHRRFIVLHAIVLPLTLSALVIGWLRVAWRSS